MAGMGSGNFGEQPASAVEKPEGELHEVNAGDSKGESEIEGNPERKSNVESENDDSLSVKELESGYKEMRETKKLITSIKTGEEELEKIRSGSGIPGMDAPGMGMDGEALVRMKKELSSKAAEIDEMEKGILEIPKDGLIEGSQKEYGTGNNKNEDLLNSLRERIQEIDEKNEKEMKKLREEFLEEWIEDSIEWASKEFRQYIDKSANGEKAEKIMAIKIKNGLLEAGDEFIESGDSESLGFSVTLHLAEYDDSEGRERQFITGIDFGEYQFDEAKEKELLGEKERKEKGQAADAGVLKEGRQES